MGDSSIYMSKCLMSPSCCIPRHEEYSRLPPPLSGGRDRDGSSGSSSSSSSNRSRRARRLWRKVIWRLLKESNKCIYDNKIKTPPLTFQYDAVSYSQNFDEGCHTQDYQYLQRFSPAVFR